MYLAMDATSHGIDLVLRDSCNGGHTVHEKVILKNVNFWDVKPRGSCKHRSYGNNIASVFD
jgi:hypothetical protein